MDYRLRQDLSLSEILNLVSRSHGLGENLTEDLREWYNNGSILPIACKTESATDVYQRDDMGDVWYLPTSVLEEVQGSSYSKNYQFQINPKFTEEEVLEILENECEPFSEEELGDIIYSLDSHHILETVYTYSALLYVCTADIVWLKHSTWSRDIGLPLSVLKVYEESTGKPSSSPIVATPGAIQVKQEVKSGLDMNVVLGVSKFKPVLLTERLFKH